MLRLAYELKRGVRVFSGDCLPKVWHVRHDSTGECDSRGTVTCSAACRDYTEAKILDTMNEVLFRTGLAEMGLPQCLRTIGQADLMSRPL